MTSWITSTDRNSLADFVRSVLPNRQVSLLTLAAQASVLEPLPIGLGKPLTEALNALGVNQAYAHQVEAISAALAGRDVIVTTGTGSGKSACGTCPAIQRCLDEPAGRALLVFPTKALAQDQVAKISEIADPLGLRVAAYDGDTPKSSRAAIRKHAQIIVTNPDMLHAAILPQHELWSSFLKGLRTIVIDEMHVYRGLFGGHVSLVLHRLDRLCEWHRSRPVMIGLSATLVDPGDHFRLLTGREAQVVSTDRAARGKRDLLLVAPYETEEFARRANSDTAKLTAELVNDGHRTLTFCRSRFGTEVVLRESRALSVDPSQIESYRSGYTAADRRKIERDLFKGKLNGLITTNAMELGVDIGGLDVVVMNGYPGSFTSLWQQAGRAGRGGREGTAILLAQADPLERLVSTEPDWLASQGLERLGPAVSNEMAVTGQVMCAAYERPLDPARVADLSPVAPGIVSGMIQEGSLAVAAGRIFYPSHNAPHAAIRIRGGDTQPVSLMLNGQVIGEMEEWRAMGHAHIGAIYMHRGDTYQVTELNWVSRTATLVPHHGEDYTLPIISGLVEPVERVDDQPQSLWSIRVTSTVTGYKRLSQTSHELIEEIELEPRRFDVPTIGLRLDFEMPSEDDLPRFITALHTLEHGLRATAPLIAGCAPGDLGSNWGIASADTLQPTIWIYDTDRGGNGVAAALRKGFAEWIHLTRTLAEGCGCEDGCPLCVWSPRCESANQMISRGALVWFLSSKSSGGILTPAP